MRVPGPAMQINGLSVHYYLTDGDALTYYVDAGGQTVGAVGNLSASYLCGV